MVNSHSDKGWVIGSIELFPSPVRPLTLFFEEKVYCSDTVLQAWI